MDPAGQDAVAARLHALFGSFLQLKWPGSISEQRCSRYRDFVWRRGEELALADGVIILEWLQLLSRQCQYINGLWTKVRVVVRGESAGLSCSAGPNSPLDLPRVIPSSPGTHSGGAHTTSDTRTLQGEAAMDWESGVVAWLVMRKNILIPLGVPTTLCSMHHIRQVTLGARGVAQSIAQELVRCIAAHWSPIRATKLGVTKRTSTSTEHGRNTAVDMVADIRTEHGLRAYHRHLTPANTNNFPVRRSTDHTPTPPFSSSFSIANTGACSTLVSTHRGVALRSHSSGPCSPPTRQSHTTQSLADKWSDYPDDQDFLLQLTGELSQYFATVRRYQTDGGEPGYPAGTLKFPHVSGEQPAFSECVAVLQKLYRELSNKHCVALCCFSKPVGSLAHRILQKQLFWKRRQLLRKLANALIKDHMVRSSLAGELTADVPPPKPSGLFFASAEDRRVGLDRPARVHLHDRLRERKMLPARMIAGGGRVATPMSVGDGGLAVHKSVEYGGVSVSDTHVRSSVNESIVSSDTPQDVSASPAADAGAVWVLGAVSMALSPDKPSPPPPPPSVQAVTSPTGPGPATKPAQPTASSSPPPEAGNSGHSLSSAGTPDVPNGTPHPDGGAVPLSRDQSARRQPPVTKTANDEDHSGEDSSPNSSEQGGLAALLMQSLGGDAFPAAAAAAEGEGAGGTGVGERQGGSSPTDPAVVEALCEVDSSFDLLFTQPPVESSTPASDPRRSSAGPHQDPHESLTSIGQAFHNDGDREASSQRREALETRTVIAQARTTHQPVKPRRSRSSDPQLPSTRTRTRSQRTRRHGRSPEPDRLSPAPSRAPPEQPSRASRALAQDAQILHGIMGEAPDTQTLQGATVEARGAQLLRSVMAEASAAARSRNLEREYAEVLRDISQVYHGFPIHPDLRPPTHVHVQQDRRGRTQLRVSGDRTASQDPPPVNGPRNSLTGRVMRGVLGRAASHIDAQQQQHTDLFMRVFGDSSARESSGPGALAGEVHDDEGPDGLHGRNLVRPLNTAVLGDPDDYQDASSPEEELASCQLCGLEHPVARGQLCLLQLKRMREQDRRAAANPGMSNLVNRPTITADLSAGGKLGRAEGLLLGDVRTGDIAGDEGFGDRTYAEEGFGDRTYAGDAAEAWVDGQSRDMGPSSRTDARDLRPASEDDMGAQTLRLQAQIPPSVTRDVPSRWPSFGDWPAAARPVNRHVRTCLSQRERAVLSERNRTTTTSTNPLTATSAATAPASSAQLREELAAAITVGVAEGRHIVSRIERRSAPAPQGSEPIAPFDGYWRMGRYYQLEYERQRKARRLRQSNRDERTLRRLLRRQRHGEPLSAAQAQESAEFLIHLSHEFQEDDSRSRDAVHPRHRPQSQDVTVTCERRRPCMYKHRDRTTSYQGTSCSPNCAHHGRTVSRHHICRRVGGGGELSQHGRRQSLFRGGASLHLKPAESAAVVHSPSTAGGPGRRLGGSRALVPMQHGSDLTRSAAGIHSGAMVCHNVDMLSQCGCPGTHTRHCTLCCRVQRPSGWSTQAYICCPFCQRRAGDGQVACECASTRPATTSNNTSTAAAATTQRSGPSSSSQSKVLSASTHRHRQRSLRPRPWRVIAEAEPECEDQTTSAESRLQAWKQRPHSLERARFPYTSACSDAGPGKQTQFHEYSRVVKSHGLDLSSGRGVKAAFGGRTQRGTGLGGLGSSLTDDQRQSQDIDSAPVSDVTVTHSTFLSDVKTAAEAGLARTNDALRLPTQRLAVNCSTGGRRRSPAVPRIILDDDAGVQTTGEGPSAVTEHDDGACLSDDGACLSDADSPSEAEAGVGDLELSEDSATELGPGAQVGSETVSDTLTMTAEAICGAPVTAGSDNDATGVNGRDGGCDYASNAGPGGAFVSTSAGCGAGTELTSSPSDDSEGLVDVGRVGTPGEHSPVCTGCVVISARPHRALNGNCDGGIAAQVTGDADDQQSVCPSSGGDTVGLANVDGDVKQLTAAHHPMSSSDQLLDQTHTASRAASLFHACEQLRNDRSLRFFLSPHAAQHFARRVSRHPPAPHKP